MVNTTPRVVVMKTDPGNIETRGPPFEPQGSIPPISGPHGIEEHDNQIRGNWVVRAEPLRKTSSCK